MVTEGFSGTDYVSGADRMLHHQKAHQAVTSMAMPYIYEPSGAG